MTAPNRVISRREFLRSVGAARSVYTVAPPLTATPLTNMPLPKHSSIGIEAADEVLPNDFLVYSTPFFENTAKAVPPGSSCPNGKIVINVGNPDGQVHVRYSVISPDQVRIDWEDLFGLGDADFNDCTVDIVAAPEPFEFFVDVLGVVIPSAGMAAATPAEQGMIERTSSSGPPPAIGLFGGGPTERLLE
jgi:hypothetical protein